MASEKNMSTNDAVRNLLDKIYAAIERKEYFGAVFIDLSKAFDTVPHDILLNKLEHYGIRGGALELIKSYLTNRKQFVSVNGNNSSLKDMTIGVPLGSVLGPLLFLIYLNDLPTVPLNTDSILFADDTTLYASNTNVNELSNTLSGDLLLVRDWMLANSLTLNANKSYYVIFSHKHVPDNVRITIGNFELDRKTQGKFLGVILDEKLTFKEHVKYISNKVSKLTGLLYKIKDFFPLQVLRNLYFSLIYPYLNYCILAWGSANISVLEPLFILQKKLVRILCNSDFYEHTSPLFKYQKILKIYELYIYNTQLFMYKCLVLNRYPDMRYSILHSQPNHDYNTRTTDFRLPFCRTSRCKQSLLYQGIKNWNSLPLEIKEKISLGSFKSSCTIFHLNKY